jgi:nucleoside-diphosphate-sugar epimerase
MKIAITGHTKGIGKALADAYQRRGHEIVGLSRTKGYNIYSILKCADLIESCDMFINNAQAGFAQTELLFEIAKRWQDTHKHIVNISSVITQRYSSNYAGFEEVPLYEVELYRVQKVALEEAVIRIRNTRTNLKLTLVRPSKTIAGGEPAASWAAEINNWAETLVKIFETAAACDLMIPEISLTSTIKIDVAPI